MGFYTLWPYSWLHQKLTGTVQSRRNQRYLCDTHTHRSLQQPNCNALQECTMVNTLWVFSYILHHRRRLWGATRAHAPNNRETPMHLPVFTTFPPNILVCPPNIFDKSMPVFFSLLKTFFYSRGGRREVVVAMGAPLDDHCCEWCYINLKMHLYTASRH